MCKIKKAVPNRPICIMEQQNSLLYNSCTCIMMYITFLENVICFHLNHTRAHAIIIMLLNGIHTNYITEVVVPIIKILHYLYIVIMVLCN